MTGDEAAALLLIDLTHADEHLLKAEHDFERAKKTLVTKQRLRDEAARRLYIHNGEA